MKKLKVALYGYPSGEILDVSAKKVFDVVFSSKGKKLIKTHKKAIDGMACYRFLDKDLELLKELLKVS